MTGRTAETVGLTDRGRIAPGLKADINVIDYAKLAQSLGVVTHRPVQVMGEAYPAMAAQQQAQQSGYKTVGIYSGPLGFGYNTEIGRAHV